MSHPRFLLDTSAIITLIEDEDGADKVTRILETRGTLITWVTLLEVQYITTQELGTDEALRRVRMIKLLPVSFAMEINEYVLNESANLKATNKISLADSLIAAYTLRYSAILVHKDPEFKRLSGLLRTEELPFKPKRH